MAVILELFDSFADFFSDSQGAKCPDVRAVAPVARKDRTLEAKRELIDALVEALSALVQRRSCVYIPTQGTDVRMFYSNLGSSPQDRNTIREVVENLVSKFMCSDAVFLMALIYMNRLERSNRYLLVNKFNVLRLFTASTLVACKFVEDEIYRNSYYAEVAGLDLKLLNHLERTVLNELDFRMYVDANEYLAVAMV
uniref:Cyclin n=1 Tax=Rhodosorus marinus TaxID=101924 RepID=A0A7S3ECN2_9RHOD|mmetsp:Transcript_26110/g.102449  ORF Transcript_26110/g.102449 Transcript_26110/m.102449 type:complete len:196 (+) Transcript_26110:87-674(+)